METTFLVIGAGVNLLFLIVLGTLIARFWKSGSATDQETHASREVQHATAALIESLNSINQSFASREALMAVPDGSETEHKTL